VLRLLRERDCLAEIRFRQFGVSLAEPQFSTEPESLGTVEQFLRVRLQSLLDRSERVRNRAFEDLRFC
jgi:hypothetical protein